MDGSVSFSFKKAKKDNVVSTLSTFDDVATHKENDKEQLCLVEGSKLKGLKPEKLKKEFVIPLIGSNRWRLPGQESSISESTDETKPPIRDATEEQAIKEILEDATKSNSEQNEERVVPLLVQNKVPAGYETDEKLDVSLRPAEKDVDYEEIPIAEFGKAMLRGMGWKEEKEDKNNSKMPVEVVPRPKGLGLGANRKNVQDMNLTETSERDGKVKEELILCKGAYCVVTSGSHRDLYGQVQGTDTENSRVIVKMTLSGQPVNLSLFVIKLVTQTEYKQYSKYLNKGKADKYKEKQAKKQKENGYNSRDSKDNDYSDQTDSDRSGKSKHTDHKHSKYDNHRQSSGTHRKRSKHSLEDHSDSDTRKRKHKHSKKDKKSSKYRRRSSSREVSPASHKVSLQELWLRPHLRVRVIDERYKKGKYFKEKVTVEDIASIDCCVCRTDEGKVLEDLCQDQLETVVPRSVPAYVMIVSGKHKTQLAEILGKDKSKTEATVQLLMDRDIVFVTNFDKICEYTGDVSTQMDF